MSQSSSSGRRLCVAMILRNAGDTLEATLSSVASIADEIVLLDTGSTDNTREIAQQFKAIIGSKPWADSFSTARNNCMKAAMADWVLWLDAGETISADDARALKQFVREQAEFSKAYAMLVKVPQQPGSIASEQIARVRLLPNLPGIEFTGRVRESVKASLDQLGIQVEGLPFRIHRGMRDHDLQIKIRRARRNLLLAELAIKESGPQPQLLNCVGDALQILGDNRQAANFFQQAAQLAPRGSTEMLEAYYGWITTFDADPTQRQTQLGVCLEALEVFPLDAQLMCAMGGYLQAEGRLDLAIRSYQTASQYGQVNPETWHLDEINEIATVCYSLALQLQNQHDEARKVLEQGIAQSPTATRLHRNLIDLHVKHGRRNEAIAVTQSLPPGTPNVEAYRIAIRGACLANDKNWIGARAYLETAFKAGCREILCLRWLAVALMALNQRDAALPILEQWLEQEPNSAEARMYFETISTASTTTTTTTAPSLPAHREVAEHAPPVSPSTGDSPLERIRRVDRKTATDTASPLMPNVKVGSPLPAAPKQV